MSEVKNMTGFHRRLVVCLAAVLLAACGGGAGVGGSEDGVPPSGPDRATGTLELGPPQGKTILTIDGAISRHNEGSTTAIDMKLLHGMPHVEATVFEPFIKKEVRFTGVLLSDFLQIVGVEERATVLSMTALDDYHVRLPLGELEPDRAMLAFQANGEPIAIADGGPTRIIFLDQAGLAANTDNWIWSVSEIVVEA
jgi:hypothetical protein